MAKAARILAALKRDARIARDYGYTVAELRKL
jgi:hypothetical protein